MKAAIKKAVNRFVSYPCSIYCVAIVLSVLLAHDVDPSSMEYVHDMLYSMPDNCLFFSCICLMGVGMGGFICSIIAILGDLLGELFVYLWDKYKSKEIS